MKWLMLVLMMLWSITAQAAENNPGNLRMIKTVWKGQLPKKGAFVTFKSKEYGYRAMAKVLLTYQRVHKLDSLTQFITRYAPPVENPTMAYILFVARECDFTTWSRINLESEKVLFAVVKAMAKFEQGKNFNDSDEVIMAGIRMALHD